MPFKKAIIQQITTNSITNLNLYYKQIGADEAKKLAEALKDNNSITFLYLHANQIGDVGVKELAQVLKDNNSITTLSLNSNKMEDAGANDIAETLKINHSITINLGGNYQIGDAGNKAIAEALQINKEFAEKARQEAERLEQEAKLREQEEVKLRTLEEVKIKEYIPEIPVVKLFEVAGGDNQLGNDDQATIRQVSELIRDGNDCLQEHGKKGVLLLGNTGTGKSILVTENLEYQVSNLSIDENQSD